MDEEELMYLILLEEEEDEQLLQYSLLQERRATHDIFKQRKQEGYFNLLINGHLREDENKFREFFRLNPQQFDFVLSLIQDYIQKSGTNFVQVPITAEEKLALTLR